MIRFLISMLFILFFFSCSDATNSTESNNIPSFNLPVSYSKTGIIKEYHIRIGYGDYPLKTSTGSSMTVLHGYFMNDQFLGPTLIANVGDTLLVTLENQTDDVIGLHPHGVGYDQKNEGVVESAQAKPNKSITYTWETDLGPGTFLYHSHNMDEQGLEKQATQGILGVIVILDPEENKVYHPDFMLNYILMNTYAKTTTATNEHHHNMIMPELHNHTMVVQKVTKTSSDSSGYITTTINNPTANAKLGQTIRVNILGFGEEFHTFHSHGVTWQDLNTGQTLDVISIGPAEYYHFYWYKLDNPGKWLIHCHVDSHIHLMTSWLEIQ